MRIVKGKAPPPYGGGAILLTLCAVAAGAFQALAAGPPIAGQLWSSQVDSRSATLWPKSTPTAR